MRLDPVTLLLTATAMNLLFIGAYALVASHARGEQRPLLWFWTLGLALQCAAYTALSSMAQWPSPMVGVLGNAFLLGAYLAFLWAVRGYAGQPVHRRRDGVIAVLFVTAAVAFNVVWPMHTPRFVIAAILLLLPVLETLAVMLLRAPRPLDVAVQVTVVPFALLALLMLARIVVELLAGWRVDPPATPGLTTQLQSFALLFMPLWATLGFTLMVNARLNAALERLAHRDPLTDLPNRRAFDVAATAAIRSGTDGIALLALDADGFKGINDAHGHPAGDRVLRCLSDRLREAVGEAGLLARMGGEEFNVLVVGATRAEALALAERLRRAVGATPVMIEAGPVVLTVSIGIGFAAPAEPDIDAAQRRADRALYAAKAAGRNRVVVGD